MKKIITVICIVLGMQLGVKAQWVQQASGTGSDLYSVYFTSVDTGYTVGLSGTILKTVNGGTNWVSQTSGTTNRLLSIFFPSVDTGFAVGFSGTILKTTNGGVTWISHSFGSPNVYTSVFFVNTLIGYVVGQGSGAVIIKTVDGGITWTNQSGGTHYLGGIYCTNSNNCYTVGDYNAMLKTTNGGSNWINYGGIGQGGESVFFTNDTSGYATQTGGTVYKTINAGISWVAQQVITTRELTSVNFVDTDTGYVVGKTGTILKSINKGITWNAQICPTSHDLTSVYFPDKVTGYAVGIGGKILKTINGGYPTPSCTPPTVTVNPTNRWDTAGVTTTFSVSVIGTPPFTYNWYTNGVLVNSTTSGSFSRSYTTPILTALDSGNIYYCVVTNCGGNSQDTSTSALVFISHPCVPVTIHHQPISQTSAVGGSLTYGVSVYGSPPFSYYWYINGNLVSSTLNSYSDTSHYTISNVSYVPSGTYIYCTIKNCGGGGTTGNGYQVTTNNALIIIQCPNCSYFISPSGNVINVIAGNSISFSASVNCLPSSNGVSFYYDWLHNGVLVYPHGLNYYTTPVLTASDDGSDYGCTVTDCSGASPILIHQVIHVICPASSVTVNSPTICSGQLATLTANGSSSYTWSAGATSSGTHTAVVSPTVTSSYTVTGISTYGCANTAVSNVTVHPQPSVTVTSPSICTGQTGTLIANGATNYTWSTGATSLGANTASVFPTVTSTYTVTGTGAFGCTNTATATVMVNSYPAIGVTANSPIICSGQADTLIANGATSYLWSTGATPLGIDSAVINPVSTLSYSVIGTTNGCSDTAYSTIIVNPSYLFNDNQSICPGSYVNWYGTNYSLAGDYSVTYSTINGCDSTYYLHLSVNNTDSTNINTASCNIYTLNSQTYTISGIYTQLLTNLNGCDSIITLNLIINSASPSLPASIIGVTHVCQGTSNTYTVTNDTNATSYTWTLPTTWTGSSDSSYITATADTTAGVIYVTANNSCGSSPPQSVNVYGSVIPVVTFAPLANICDNAASFALSGGNPPGGVYSGQGVNSNIFIPATVGTGTYYITYTYVNGACTIMDSVPITVDICLGINQTTSEDGISIFPNPFTSETTIIFSEDQKNTVVIIKDVLGKEIRTINFTGKKCILEKGEMQAGIYFLQIMNEKKNVVNKKVVVQ